MSLMEEIGQDFMKTLLAILALIVGVGLFLAYSISIWLLVLVLVVVGGVFMLVQMKR